MGNAIAKRFDLPKEHTATAGHVNNWRIWPGKRFHIHMYIHIQYTDKLDLMDFFTRIVDVVMYDIIMLSKSQFN